MFSIVRSGPKILILESSSIHEVIVYFKNHFSAFQCNIDIAFEKSNEDNIVILLTEKMKELISLTDIKDILIKAGINVSRLNTIGQGEDNSVDVNSIEAKSLVRKVTFKLK